MEQHNTVSSSRRIEWIDAAKGIAIILMIIGHTMDYGNGIRNIIFSFHMPLFFILSGYTFKLPSTWQQFGRKFLKDIKHLLLPVLVTIIVRDTVSFMLWTNHTASAYFQMVKTTGNELLWASGIEFSGHPALGALWFLISMFTAREVLSVINLLFPSDQLHMIPIGIGVLGLMAGTAHIWGPINFDVSCVAVLFLTIGMIAREQASWIRKNQLPVLIISLMVWMLCAAKGVYIEMATRSYPLLSISVVNSVLGTYICCCVARAVLSNRPVKRTLLYLGRITLPILCVHCLDSFAASIWQHGGKAEMCVLRIILVITVAAIYTAVKKLIVNGKRR